MLTWTARPVTKDEELLDGDRVTADLSGPDVGAVSVRALRGREPHLSVGADGLRVQLEPGSTVALLIAEEAYPGPMAVVELTASPGATVAWGPALFTEEGGYAATLVGLGAEARIEVQRAHDSAATVSVSAPVERAAGHPEIVSASFTGSVASLFRRDAAGVDLLVEGVSASTVSADPLATDQTVVEGYPNQRDPDATLRLGVVITAGESGGQLHLERIRAGVYGGATTREVIPVRRASDGAPVRGEDGRYLVTSTAQGPSIDGRHNYLSWWGIRWYNAETGTLGRTLRRVYSVRPAPWQTGDDRTLCTDSDGCILFEDRPDREEFGGYHVYLGTTGTDYQYLRDDPVYNTYQMIHQLVDEDLASAGPDLVLDAQIECEFPSGVIAPYDVKVLPMGDRWYALGLCSRGGSGATVVPTTWFMAVGDGPTSFTEVIKPPLPETTSEEWDGSALGKIGDTWYGLFVNPHGTVAARLDDGVVIETVPLPGSYRLFVPHANLLEHQTLVDGRRVTEFHRFTHDLNFVSWGHDFGADSPWTWMFGGFEPSVSQAVDGWQFDYGV